jgi:hypothetical protein
MRLERVFPCRRVCFWSEGKRNALGAGNGEFPGTGDGLDHDVCFLDARGDQLCFGAGQEGLNYCCARISGSVR